MKKRLVLIDGNAILHRAYHALPKTLTTSDGEPINALYGFVSMLIRIVADLKPTHIACAFDTPVETFRKAWHVGYQANRPRMESELSDQFDKTYEALTAMNIPIYRLERFEADDVIGTIVSQVKRQDPDANVIIVTGDRDILQLVDERVWVYMPVNGLSKAKLYKEDEVAERMGIGPRQIVDLKALIGDASDNYKGVSGIGPKTAVGLLSQFGDLENIYKNLDKIPPGVAKKLAEGVESAGMSRKLAQIITDAPITFRLDDAGKWNLASKETLEYFRKIGFKTLTNRVQQLGMI